MNNNEIFREFTDFDDMVRNVCLQLYSKNITKNNNELIEINEVLFGNSDYDLIYDINNRLLNIYESTLCLILKNGKAALSLYNMEDNTSSNNCMSAIFTKSIAKRINTSLNNTFSPSPIIKIDAKDLKLSRFKLRIISYLAKYRNPMNNKNITNSNLSIKINKYEKRLNKLTWNYGWLKSYNNVSDCFILYTKIIMLKKICSYVKTFTEKINQALKQYHHLNHNLIVENTDFQKFEEAWKNFQKEKLSLDELSEIVYSR